MIERNRIHEGMVVRSAEGRRLGQVLACQEGSFLVTTDYVARYDDVADISGDEIRLALPQQSVGSSDQGSARWSGFDASLGADVDASAIAPWAWAEEEEEEASHGRARDEEGEGPKYRLGERPDGCLPSYGDEGSSGI